MPTMFTEQIRQLERKLADTQDALMSVRARMETAELNHSLRIAAAVAAERERIALAWDGCVHEAPSGDVDIGASIRAGHLVGSHDA